MDKKIFAGLSGFILITLLFSCNLKHVSYIGDDVYNDIPKKNVEKKKDKNNYYITYRRDSLNTQQQFPEVADVLSNYKKNDIDIKSAIKDSSDSSSIRSYFPGGDTALLKFIIKNIKYPEIAKENCWQDKVFVSFIISETGKVTQVEVIQGKYEVLNDEAVRVVSLLSYWEPAKSNGENVSSTIIIPVTFKLSCDEKTDMEIKRNRIREAKRKPDFYLE